MEPPSLAPPPYYSLASARAWLGLADPRTLTRWLAQAGITPRRHAELSPDAYDPRPRLITRADLERLAVLHGRPLRVTPPSQGCDTDGPAPPMSARRRARAKEAPGTAGLLRSPPAPAAAGDDRLAALERQQRLMLRRLDRLAAQLSQIAQLTQAVPEPSLPVAVGGDAPLDELPPDRLVLPAGYVAFTTWCRRHGLDDRRVAQASLAGKMPCPVVPPAGMVWRHYHQNVRGAWRYYEVRRAYTPEQQEEAAVIAAGLWPKWWRE